MKAFGFSLLPVALFATIGETLSTAFLSAGRDTGISIQWGVLIAFAVTMCLVTVFKYGIQLQKNRMKRCKGADNGTYCFKAGPRNGGPENEPE